MRDKLFRFFFPTAYHLLQLRKEVEKLRSTVIMHDYYLYTKRSYLDHLRFFRD